VTVDEKGFSALARELDAMLERIKKIEADSKKRLAGAGHDSEQEATVVLMLFNSPAETPKPTKRNSGARRPAARRASRTPA
jgi:hypothetical protein